MKTATVREVQHNLKNVLQRVERGESVTITRRGRAIATLGPAQRDSQAPPWPDFMGRLASIWGGKPAGKPASQLLIEHRHERP
ncbi:MAG TPA: type II toxin-antitoxin system prevent-host-death family antitoxin [Terriglobales bacterium]|nr:type II toxin-antitoxin system prevent-host-death family antitoxin [Terriglobales bacterium]